MQSIEQVYQRLAKSKAKRKEWQKMMKDELAQHSQYKELTEQIGKLRDDKRRIEQEIRSHVVDLQEIDELKADIQTDQELLADIALNMFVEKQNVEILDEHDQRWVPVFSVKFVKD